MKRYVWPVIGVAVFCGALFLYGGNAATTTLLFFVMNGAVIATALCMANRYYAHLDRRMFIESVFLFSIGEIVLVETILGIFGILSLTPVLIAVIAVLVAVFRPPKKTAEKAPPINTGSSPRAGPLTIILWAAAAVFLSAMIAQALVTPPHGWDSYTYHVHFPITWLKNGNLSIIPTPFGDPSVAYAPFDGELFFLWLILPFHEDFLASLGQLPFLFIGALGLYGIARGTGIGRDASSWACLLFIFTPAVIAQAVHAYVDIVFLALFILSLEFLILYLREEKKSSLVLASIGLGLFYGTKSLAIAYSILLLPLIAAALLRRPRKILQKFALLVLGLVLLGGFWYIRNLVVTGNPLYPLTIKIAGFTLFPGMFDKEALLRGYPHIVSAAAAWAKTRMIFGSPLAWLALCSIPFAAYAFLRQKRRPVMTAYLLSLPFLFIAVFQFLTPAHSAERFLLIAVPFCFLYPAYASTISRPFKWIVGFAVAACLILTVRQNPYLTNMMKFVWITALGLRRGGIPAARPAIVWSLASAGIFLAYLLLHRIKLARRVCALCALIAAALSLAGAAAYFSTDSYKHAYRPSSPHTAVAGFALNDSYEYIPNPNLLEHAWLWLDRNTSGANIAWAGLNIPGALYGTGLKNNVTYVNINGHAEWKEHDYDRLYRGRAGYTPPPSLKPGYYRREADHPSWLANLRAENIEYLFVTNLSPQERRYLRHNEEGFPVEDAWARQNPDTFTLVYTSPPQRNPWDGSRVRIYRLN